MLCSAVLRMFRSPIKFLKRGYTGSQLSRRRRMPCEKWQCYFPFMCKPIGYSSNCKVLYSSTVAKNDLTSLDSVDSINNEPKKGKIFEDSEAKFHHKILENINVYSNTIFKEDPYFIEKYRLSEEEYQKCISTEDWGQKSAYDIALSFISLGIYSSSTIPMHLSDPRLDKLVFAFVNKCSSFTDDQLIDCLIALQYWPEPEHVKEHNFLEIWKCLDTVCHERLIDWSVDKILFVTDLWYQIRLTRLSFFIFKGLLKISRKCSDLNRAQMVQTLFYFACTRKPHPAISFREYEYYMQKHITYLSIEEIGIFALAFFKTKMTVRNQKLLLYMMQRGFEEIDSIPQMTLTAITKILRFSHKPELGFTTNDFVNKLIESRIDSMNLINTIHTLHITTQVQFYNEDAITRLAEKYCSNPSEARLKDMERIAFILSLFNYIPPSTPNILEIMMEELDDPRHVLASKAHQLTLISLVYFLTLLQAYPEKQIRQILDEKYLDENFRTRFQFPVQAIQVEYNRALEGPAGSEYLLPPTLREYLARRHALYVPDKDHPPRNKFDDLMTQVIDLSAEVLGGQENFLATHILPHFPRPDILFHLDKSGKPTAIPDEMRNTGEFEDVTRAPDPEGWFAVLLGGRNMYMHNVPRLVGEQTTKLRQLKLAGYTPIVIPYHYWQGEKNKLDYLKLKYFTRPDAR